DTGNTDGGTSPDGGSVKPPIAEAGPPIVVDAGPPVIDASVPCTPPSFGVGIGGNNDCKLNIDWACGTTKYSIGGVCTAGKGYSGFCSVNGMTVKMFADPNPKDCSCNDPKSSFMPLANDCGFPTN